MKLTGIVMAGGKSSRMGKDKGLMMYKGKPLVTYSLETLKDICEETVISTNNEEYDGFGYRLINDKIKEIGPIGGLFSSLKISKNEWNIVLACDMPFVSGILLNELISQIDSTYDAVVPQNENGQFEGLCALYSKKCIPHIEQSIKKREYGLYKLINTLKVREVSVSENSRNFTNLNTLDEFNRIDKEI